MNNMYLGIGIVVVLCAIMLAIGFLVSKRNKTTADYYVGSRSIGSLVTICTACATFVGGGMTLGSATAPFAASPRSGTVFRRHLVLFSLQKP